MSAVESEETKKPATGEEEEEEEEDEDLEKLQAEIARMEEEAARITKETEELEQKKAPGGAAGAATSGEGENKNKDGSAASATPVDPAKRDAKSIYVGQVDYGATPEELLSVFEPCGTVERVTIVCDKYTGRPKGFAYIEFVAEDAVENALKLDGTTFRERQLKVTHKRVNDPNFYFEQSGGGRGGGRMGGRGGYRGRGRGPFRGGYRGRGPPGGYRGGYRGGGRGYHPYY